MATDTKKEIYCYLCNEMKFLTKRTQKILNY